MREHEVSAPKRSISGFSVDDAFTNQVAYCRANDAPITARIVEAIGQLVRTPTSPFLQRIADWQGSPLADAVPLRAAAGFHALHQQGRAPELAPLYANDQDGNAADLLSWAIQNYEPELLPWLDSPPQTNEAGRSSNFVAGLLWLTALGSAPRYEILEIGSSAGINLMMARYHYSLGGVELHPLASPINDHANPIQFKPDWRGNPPPDGAFAIASARGCDIAPMDLTTPADASRLKAYIWPEHHLRFERLQSAITMAEANPPKLEQANAADFIERALRQPQETGVTRTLVHSIMWQYMPADQQDRVTTAMETAGAKATKDRPLAWISLEANRHNFYHELIVRQWPDHPEPTLLARAHAHGQWIEWLADQKTAD
jgi:hypothetical protein